MLPKTSPGQVCLQLFEPVEVSKLLTHRKRQATHMVRCMPDRMSVGEALPRIVLERIYIYIVIILLNTPMRVFTDGHFEILKNT